MVECSFLGTCRMTCKTGRTVIGISLDLLVTVIHVGHVVGVTINACVLCITGRIGVALGTTVPGSVVLARINGK